MNLTQAEIWGSLDQETNPLPPLPHPPFLLLYVFLLFVFLGIRKIHFNMWEKFYICHKYSHGNNESINKYLLNDNYISKNVYNTGTPADNEYLIIVIWLIMMNPLWFLCIYSILCLHRFLIMWESTPWGEKTAYNIIYQVHSQLWKLLIIHQKKITKTKMVRKVVGSK